MKNLNEKIKGFCRILINKLLIRRLNLKDPKQISLKSNQRLILAILAFGLVAFVWEQSKISAPAQTEAAHKSVDTFIPLGFVLVPIQLANADSLDSMISTTGVVDLFVPDMKKPGHSKKVAEHIKILRAPLNPNQFAVLVPEKNSGQLVHYEGAYFAVVQNPQTLGTQFETHSIHKQPSRLTMEDVSEFR